MNRYIGVEFNRLFKWKMFVLIAFTIVFAATLIHAFFPDVSSAFIMIVRNLTYLYILGVCISVATDDFENGTYIQVFTGRLCSSQIIFVKVIVPVAISLFLSALICLITLLIEYESFFGIFHIMRFCGITAVSNIAGTMLLTSVAVLMGVLIKNQGFCLIIMYSLFFGVFATIMEFARSHLRQGSLAEYLLAPFTIVPQLMINGEFSLTWILFSVGVSLLNCSIVCCTRKSWLG